MISTVFAAAMLLSGFSGRIDAPSNLVGIPHNIRVSLVARRESVTVALDCIFKQAHLNYLLPSKCKELTDATFVSGEIHNMPLDQVLYVLTDSHANEPYLSCTLAGSGVVIGLGKVSMSADNLSANEAVAKLLSKIGVGYVVDTVIFGKHAITMKIYDEPFDKALTRIITASHPEQPFDIQFTAGCLIVRKRPLGIGMIDGNKAKLTCSFLDTDPNDAVKAICACCNINYLIDGILQGIVSGEFDGGIVDVFHTVLRKTNGSHYGLISSGAGILQVTELFGYDDLMD